MLVFSYKKSDRIGVPNRSRDSPETLSLSNPSNEPFLRAILEKQPTIVSFCELFEHLPSTYFYVKDRDHRYIYVNQLVLRDVFGLDSLGELLGKTDLAFQPPALAEACHAEDRRVMESGKTIPDQVWLVPRVQGPPKWYVSTKTPLRDSKGEAIGIAGVMYPVEPQGDREAYFRELAPVVAYMEANSKEDLSIKSMAGMGKRHTSTWCRWPENRYNAGRA